jgi:hypothetical protein
MGRLGFWTGVFSRPRGLWNGIKGTLVRWLVRLGSWGVMVMSLIINIYPSKVVSQGLY